jgi:hypothetical protein
MPAVTVGIPILIIVVLVVIVLVSHEAPSAIAPVKLAYVS